MQNTTATPSQRSAFHEMHERILRAHEQMAADPKRTAKQRAQSAAKAAEVRAFIASL